MSAKVTKSNGPKVAQASVRFSQKTADTIAEIRKLIGIDITLTAMVSRGLEMLRDELKQKRK